MTALRFRGVVVEGATVDVHVDGGVVSAIGRDLAADPTAERIDGAGRPLIPGLHDHHIHLLATAASSRSLRVGPADVVDAAGLARALRAAVSEAGPEAWVRATGYHDAVAGPLDRWALDRIVGDHPVRVQHRSGALWILSSAACRSVGLDDRTSDGGPEGVERDAEGRPNGRLLRLDRWLRERLPETAAPDLAALALRLNRLGVVGVTDASAVETPEELARLADASSTLHVQATGGVALAGATFPAGVDRGPVKVVLDDHDLPALEDLIAWFATAHRHERNVAVHCVSRLSLVFALAAWDEGGARPGDRVEHGSVIPRELVSRLAHHRLTVVTQPGFVAERGDQYLADVDPADLDDLYRCRTLLDAGVPVAGSTDAPYSEPDPWAAMVAAIRREAPSGRVLGPAERVRAEQALDLFMGPLDAPGGPPRRVAVGQPADVALLSGPLEQALNGPSAEAVALTVRAGRIVWRDDA
ncbi:MAG: amidohydrolase [Acidimicrobiales bacterium]|nr:amidohydrolase [Acidimicrobiales bacterium]